MPALHSLTGRALSAARRWRPPGSGGGGGGGNARPLTGDAVVSLHGFTAALRPALRPGRSPALRGGRSITSATSDGGGPGQQPPGPGGNGAQKRATSTRAGPTTTPPHASTTGPRVCVLGGGFGGLYTAVRLEDLMWPRGTRPRVTLIDKGDRFVFKPLLYELLNGGASADEVAPRFDRLLAPTRVAFVRGAVDRVEEAPAGSGTGGTVVLDDGSAVEYDWLVCALGGETATYGVPGAADLALPFCSFEDAVTLDARLAEVEARVRAAGAIAPTDAVVVVGAGYAGVELAATVADRFAGSLAARGLPVPPVTVVTYSDDILDGAPAGQRAAAAAQLATAGVGVRTRASVSRVSAAPGPGGPTSARSVALRGTAGGADSPAAASSRDDTLTAGLVLWTAGTGPVTRSDGGGPGLPFPRSPRGAIRVEPTLRVVDHPRAFALGDVAGVEPTSSATAPLAPTAQVAFQQADYAAWNVWAAINGRRLLPFRYQHLGEMMSLGRGAGAVTLPVPVPPGLASAVAKSPLGGVLGAVGVRLPGGEDGDGAPPPGPSGLTLEGPLAGALRRAAYWYRQPTGGQRVAVGRAWLQGVAADIAAAARGAGGRKKE